MDISSPDNFLDSLFSYLRPKGESKALDDTRPTMIGPLLAQTPAEAMLMASEDFAAAFSAHLAGKASEVTIEAIEQEFEYADEDELEAHLGDIFDEGRVSLKIDSQRADIAALIDQIKALPGGPAYLARVAIYLSHGRRSKRAAIHLFTAKQES
jgi:hypothetical protein